jgi:hypothetical protein
MRQHRPSQKKKEREREREKRTKLGKLRCNKQKKGTAKDKPLVGHRKEAKIQSQLKHGANGS